MESRETPYSTQTSIPTLVLQWEFSKHLWNQGLRLKHYQKISSSLLEKSFAPTSSSPKFRQKHYDLQDFGILLMPFRALPWVTRSSRRKQPGKIPLTDTCRPRWKRPGRPRRGGGGYHLHGLRRSECTVNSEKLKFCAFKVFKDQSIGSDLFVCTARLKHR